MSNNKIFTESEIIKQIDLINNLFTESRAAFPYLADNEPDALLTKTNKRFYIFNFYTFTPQQREFHNKIGHFQNQNFLVRLFAVLQYYGVYNNFDESKYKKLAVLKKLRNEFGHGLGTYNPKSSKDRKLLQLMIKVFNLPKIEYKDFPINIDTVINEIIKEAKQYIKEHYSQQ